MLAKLSNIKLLNYTLCVGNTCNAFDKILISCADWINHVHYCNIIKYDNNFILGPRCRVWVSRLTQYS